MSIAFTRSLRSLNNDHGRFPFALLAIIIGLLLAWIAWFFLAQIPIYEVSSTIAVQRDGMLFVTFPEAALARIVPGQEALFFPTVSNHEPARSWSAVVMDTPSSTARRVNHVQVFVYAPQPLTQDATGEVRIVVQKTTPFALVLQSNQQANNPATLSSQG